MKPHFVFVLALLIVASTVVTGQVAKGTPAFGSYGGGPFDIVNLGNLNVRFAIPILHKAGRGLPFAYDLSYDSSVWTPTSVNGVMTWVPDSNWGWRGWTEAQVGWISYVKHRGGSCGAGNGIWFYWDTYVYHDKLGIGHPYSGIASTDCNGNFTGFSMLANDGSGYTLAVAGQLATDVTITTALGVVTNPPTSIKGNTGGAGTQKDANGNQITLSSDGTQFFDTLSSTTPVLTVSSPSPPVSSTLTYTAPSGGIAAYSVNYQVYTLKTSFGVASVPGEYGPLSNALVSSIALPDDSANNPDRYTFTYEQTPGSCTPLSNTFQGYCTTGRIASITLPTGGTISYSYSGGSNGIESDGSTATLTRVLSPATSCSSGGCWQYSRALVSGTPGPGSTWTTNVTDPNGNQTVMNFAEDIGTANPNYNFYETQRQVYQGTNSLLMTVLKCYNGHFTSCDTAPVGLPNLVDVYTKLPNGSTRASEKSYNQWTGLVSEQKEYDYGITFGGSLSSSNLIRDTTITYAGLSGINGQPSQIQVDDWTSGSAVTVSKTTYGYDQSAVTQTSGTPQHVAHGTARGNLTTLMRYTSGTATLTETFTYYDTGNPNVVTDINGAQTTYLYGAGSCGNSFPTTINEPLGLTRSLAYDSSCTGGMAVRVIDENGHNITTTYSDVYFWRPNTVSDQSLNQTNISYIGKVTVEAALQNFNGGNSASDVRTTTDGFGRPILSQRLQAPGISNYDTVETDYNNVGLSTRTTMPFSAAAGVTSLSAPGRSTTYDALGRVLSVTDGNGGQVSYTYTNNDVLQTVSGGQTFQKQYEYDGLGRLTSVCEVTQLTGSGSCTQNSALNGFWTKYTYDALGRMLTVQQNAQASSGQQTRTFAYDMLGRMTSESNPETGNSGSNGLITYTYDSISPCGDGNNYSYPGDLVQKQDNAGNKTCYSYDPLHRFLTAGNSSISGATLRKFFYDSKSSYPTGVSVSNAKTLMVEAQTTTTTGILLTDEFFSYDPLGELTDVYELTPHSGSYYHTTATYWPTGTLKTLSGIPSVPTLNYGGGGSGLDAEGRITQVTASPISPVTNVTYSTTSNSNFLGALTNVTYGSGDTDSFTYDPNSGRLASYAFSVNSRTDVGTLSWNANGTLQRLQIIDQIPNTVDTQTCNYYYDDLGRVNGQYNSPTYNAVDCGSKWQQSFTLDAFGNLRKSGTSSFLPTYSTATNQFTVSGGNIQYDGNGNLTSDNLGTTYSWDKNFGNPTVINGTNLIYDALGRMVEQQRGSAYTEILYSPMGKTALMNGGTLTKAFVYLPGAGTAIYNSSGLAYYRHSDWIGSSRLTSTQTRGLYTTSAYAPFGEQYATYPSGGSLDPSHTGQNADTVSTLYDFWFREYSPSQGRWVSPDPAGIAAVEPTSPQTWNRYVYAQNSPCLRADPLGLADCTIKISLQGNNHLTAAQIVDAALRINSILAQANVSAAFVQQNADFTANLVAGGNAGRYGDTPKTFYGGAPGTGWGSPGDMANIYVNNIADAVKGRDLGGAVGNVVAHELTHFLEGSFMPGSYIGYVQEEGGTDSWWLQNQNLPLFDPKKINSICKKLRAGSGGGDGGGGAYFGGSPFTIVITDIINPPSYDPCPNGDCGSGGGGAPEDWWPVLIPRDN